MKKKIIKMKKEKGEEKEKE